MTIPKKPRPTAHSGHTDKGDIRDLKIERLGKVTIYKRGPSYYLYYREEGRSQRQKVVSQITGHRSLDMLKRYTHPSVAAKRQAVERMTPAQPEPITTKMP